jgi:hypothetical protein
MGNILEQTDDGIVVAGVEYRRLEVAAVRIGLHPGSLQRLWRNSGATDEERNGLKLGRTLFFADSHLAQLGYSVRRQEGGE